MGTIWLERRKWPDRPHYGHDATWLGEDQQGTWLARMPGSPFYRGEEFLFIAPGGGDVILVPHDDWWMAWFALLPLEPPNQFSLYVDIVTPPIVDKDNDVITMVDLDFDVIRWHRDGKVELVDEDEFEEHRVVYGYPHDLEHAARQAAARVHEAVQRGHEPFTHAPAHWVERTHEAVAAFASDSAQPTAGA